jgi:hypothetical protein
MSDLSNCESYERFREMLMVCRKRKGLFAHFLVPVTLVDGGGQSSVLRPPAGGRTLSGV